MSQDIVYKVKSSIYGHRRGWCFTPNDFLHLGNDLAVRQALFRLQKNGFTRRIAWGLYEYPREHNRLGILPPDIHEVVKAIARKSRIKVIPSGAYAANLLGLSKQVPSKIVYLTEGLSKTIKVGKTQIIFKKTTPKMMSTVNANAGLVIQALRHLGINHVDDSVIALLRKKLLKEEKVMLKKSGDLVPRWMNKIILRITEGH